jgi:N-acetylglucosaminyldiphosphoundecaprenol N-acetyl-beta-D-mannosaminyltransferase
VTNTETLPAAAGSAMRRRVVSLFGLPFDRLTLDETVAAIRHACATRRRLFLSTANVNFVVQAQRDAAFRKSLLDSDLCVADGAPIVWISRLVGRPLPERVAGADVFEALRRSIGPTPVTVYFFGGPPGVAERACASLGRERGGLRCVGFQFPGFGDIASMSRPETIACINAAAPDFIVVALGASKGQAWIQANRHQLDAPVLCHLGAVVNFVAGNVARAPRWVARSGFEWLWRIAQEPALFRRYLGDFFALLRLATHEVMQARRGHTP